MTKLYITEFSSLQTANRVGHAGESAQIVCLPGLGTQDLTPTAISQQSTAMRARTKIVLLQAVEACHITSGANPVATTSDIRLPAESERYFGIAPGDKIAVIAAL